MRWNESLKSDAISTSADRVRNAGTAIPLRATTARTRAAVGSSMIKAAWSNLSICASGVLTVMLMSERELPEVHDGRKVIRIGSSTGVTLSADALEALGLEKGDSVKVVKYPDDEYARIYPDE